MNLKQYMLEVYRPMQNQARARGMTPSDVPTEQSMKQNLSQGFLDEANKYARDQSTDRAYEGLDLRSRGLDLGQRRLDIQQEQFDKQKQVAPWATGLGVANVGLSALQGWNSQNQAKQNRLMQQSYMDQIMKFRKQRLSGG